MTRRLRLFFLGMAVFWLAAGWAAAQEAGETEGTAIEEEAAGEAEAAARQEAAQQEEAASEEESAIPEEEALAEDSPDSAAFSVPEDQQIQPSGKGLDELVSLDLRNIDVTEALRFLAQKGGLNMVISKNVAGRVQFLLNDVPIRDVLDLIFITNALAYETHGDVYYIMTEAEYKERFGRSFSDTRIVKVFRLKYAVPDQAFSLLEILKSDIGRLLIDPESGTVLVMDTPENVEKMRRALAGLEAKRGVKIYDLKYAKALDVEARLKNQLDNKKVGFISADERTNQVIVETYPDRMDEIDMMISALDNKTREVLIDAKVIQVVLDDDIHKEIEWEALFSTITQYGTTFLGNHPFKPLSRLGKSAIEEFATIAPTSTPLQVEKNEATENLVIGSFLDKENAFEVLINFLRQIGDTKVLSNPKLAVVNNEEAKIHVGEKQAYVTTTTTTGQTTTTTAETVTFIDIGIQLSVTPTINDDGFVTMKIKPEISSVINFLVTPSGNRIPIIDSSLAETSVMVKDGVTLIIGGLRKEEKKYTGKKVPFLGDIPILGQPFRSEKTETLKTELLILITPRIIYGDKLVADQGLQPDDTPYLSYNDYSAYGGTFTPQIRDLSGVGGTEGVKAAPIKQ